MSFWMVIALLLAGAWWAITQIRMGLGFPMIAVLGTVTTWYVGDALYNDYGTNHSATFTPEVLNAAWWEVAWFIIAFLFLAPTMHHWMNARELGRPSQLLTMFQNGVKQPQFQFQLNQLFWGCITVWLILVGLAVIRLGDQIPYYFFPFLSYKADPWGRGQIGGGISALLSLAGYFQTFVAVMFGVVAALAQDRRVRAFAMAACVLTWPYYIFDRTRNSMLAVVLPALLAWVFLRLRVSIFLKILILATSFMLVSVWFDFVIANRSNTSITAAFQGEGISVKEASKETHHEGLNMYEELCWINSLIANGTYQPNWGEEYFSELANPIPRGLWPGKPMIGLDYAVARGQSYTDDGSVTATISTGMIGQGVVNFGRWLGPPFVAFLLSLWVAILARLDLCGERLGYIPLYALGLILTFNMGRDITFITLYTFVFGAALVWWLGRRKEEPSPETLSNVPTRHERPSPRLTVAPFSVTTPEAEKRKAEVGRQTAEKKFKN